MHMCLSNLIIIIIMLHSSHHVIIPTLLTQLHQTIQSQALCVSTAVGSAYSVLCDVTLQDTPNVFVCWVTQGLT